MNHATAPPVFLDRDGTLIVEMNYLSDPDKVLIEGGVLEGLALLQASGHPLIVLSNQSGIGRGLFTEADARRVNARADALLRRHGIGISGWYLCPHVPEYFCACRKPLPGMAASAARELNLSLAGSYVIGDKRADLELADAIDATGILVTTGHGREFTDWARVNSRIVLANLSEAAEYIVELSTGAASVQ